MSRWPKSRPSPVKEEKAQVWKLASIRPATKEQKTKKRINLPTALLFCPDCEALWGLERGGLLFALGPVHLFIEKGSVHAIYSQWPLFPYSLLERLQKPKSWRSSRSRFAGPTNFGEQLCLFNFLSLPNGPLCLFFRTVNQYYCIFVGRKVSDPDFWLKKPGKD